MAKRTRTQPTPQVKSDPPVNLVIPSTTEQKLKAICDLAAACNQVARALVSTNVVVNISNNTITMDGGNPGINISQNSDL